MSAGFASLQSFVRDHAGIALEEDKRYLVESRLQPVMRDAKIASFDGLAQKLWSDPRSDLTTLVVEALTINETSFFRDRALFTAFSERLLPALIAQRKEQRRLRIWCAGCSTGQEPYSLAMLIDEQARQLSVGRSRSSRPTCRGPLSRPRGAASTASSRSSVVSR